MHLPLLINTLRPRQNGRHFPDDIFKCIFVNENIWISINITLKFVPKFQLTLFQYWFRQWLGADQATSHCLNQWKLIYWHIYAPLGLNELAWDIYRVIISQSALSGVMIHHEGGEVKLHSCITHGVQGRSGQDFLLTIRGTNHTQHNSELIHTGMPSKSMMRLTNIQNEIAARGALNHAFSDHGIS